MRGWRKLASAVTLLTLAAGGSAWIVRERGRRAELAQAKAIMDEGHYATASVRLERLAAGSWTGDGEVWLLLGECDLANGRRERGLAALGRVPDRSPFFSQAATLRGTQLLNIGRYSAAEEVLTHAVASAPVELAEAPIRALNRLYRFQGRFRDVKRLIIESWPIAVDPAGLLKELWLLDHSPMPLESWGRALEKADPDDDRVWLGHARNDTLAGRFAAAGQWLERCRARRPQDRPIWTAELELAVASDDLDRFWMAAANLADLELEPTTIAELRVWLAAQAHAPAIEERELKAELATNPQSARALERLAALATAAGKAQETDRLHREKAELDEARDAYRKALLDSGSLYDKADRLAELAGRLGRAFDHQAWTIVAQAVREGARFEPPPPGRSPAPFLSGPLRTRGLELARRFATQTPREPTAVLLESRLADLKTAANSATIAHGGVGTDAKVAVPRFVDKAREAGLSFVFDNGQTPERLLPETMSGGVGLLDFDGDGWLDVYCVQGGSLAAGDPPAEKASGTVSATDGDRLFHNRGDGTFEDAALKTGIARLTWGKGYGMGVAIGDYDNDGRPDLIVTRLRTYQLLHNRGDGTFEDATAASGLAGVRDNPTSAAFADLDNDGDLDLYVCHYMIWDPAHPSLCKNDKGDYFYCDPSRVLPAPDHVFRNNAGRFVDVTAECGMAESGGRGLGVVAVDVDDDNRIDLFVANDGTTNYLFHNLGGFRFEEIALQAGVAGNAGGGYQAGMGVAAADLDGDGLPELMVTNFYGEGATLHQNLGHCFFTDRSQASGLELATKYLLGFGIATADVDRDGRVDVMITNGHVNDNRPFYRYAMPGQLFLNRPGGRLLDVSERSGDAWTTLRVGRGLAAGDLDNDGWIDAVVLPQNEPLAYLHNEGPPEVKRDPSGGFVSILLEGTRSNRDGVGARVVATVGKRKQVLERQGGGSYQSAGDPRLSIGLGPADRVDEITVRWPSGAIDHYVDLKPGRGYRLCEGDPSPQPLKGFPSHP